MISMVHLRSVVGWSESVFDVFGEERFERQIEIVSAQFSGTSHRTILHNWKWLTLPELIEKNSFQLFFEKQELLEPVLELYLEILTSTHTSNRRVFLNVVQALETDMLPL